jgi:hypothetical protein
MEENIENCPQLRCLHKKSKKCQFKIEYKKSTTNSTYNLHKMNLEHSSRHRSYSESDNNTYRCKEYLSG